MTRLRLASGIVLLLGGAMSLASFAGCGAAAENDTFGAGGNSSGNGAGSLSGGTESSGLSLSGGSLSSGSLSGGGGNCGGVEYTGEKLPLAMYIMLDKSGSMDESAGAGSKWQAVTGALQLYINAPTSTGVEVGIQYFPLPAGPGPMVCPIGCTAPADAAACAACGGTCLSIPPFIDQCVVGGDSCNPMDYATPAVPMGPLPANATALINSINSNAPNGGTPTSASLQGGIDFARAYATMNPNKKVIHVYVTDGNPSGCDNNLNNIYAIAAAGFNGSPSIQTYVIGVGSNINSLQGIAMAGGSSMPFLVDASPNAGQQFVDAMNSIQGTALTCTYTIPVPTMGTFDPGMVNVEYTPTGGTPQTIPHVKDQASCPTGGMGWYYDNAANPTLIHLCPDTCTKITADVTGSIKIVLGCPTQGPF